MTDNAFHAALMALFLAVVCGTAVSHGTAGNGSGNDQVARRTSDDPVPTLDSPNGRLIPQHGPQVLHPAAAIPS